MTKPPLHRLSHMAPCDADLNPAAPAHRGNLSRGPRPCLAGCYNRARSQHHNTYTTTLARNPKRDYGPKCDNEYEQGEEGDRDIV